MNKSKNPTVFFGAIAVAVIALVLCVYYAIPGIYHPFTASDPMAFHPTHAIGFFAIAVICVLAAMVTRPKSTAR